MKFITLAALLVIAQACGSAPGVLTDSGKEVQTLDNKPGSECSVVGKVVGENEQGSPEMARNHARNLSAKLNGNAMFINQEVPNGGKIQVFATAYQCE
jgi:hypothetical protein